MPRVESTIIAGCLLILGLGLAGCAAPPAQQAGADGAGATSPPSRASSAPAAPGGDVAELSGITWLMTAASVNGEAMTVPGAFEGNGGLTLIVGDGSLGGYDGCNWFSGPAEVANDIITPTRGDTMSTSRACVRDKVLTNTYSSFLRSPFRWTVDDGVLKIGDDGSHFDFVPFPEGFPSDVAGKNHPTIATGTDGELRYRVYTSSETPGQDLCITLEFWNNPGQNEQPAAACRATDTARRYVVNPTDFHSADHRGRGVVLGAVPSGTAARIAVHQQSGKSVDLTLAPIPGTDYLAFYGFVPGPRQGDTAHFYDKDGNVIDPAWKLYW